MATLQVPFRRVLVNDLVHSFCYAVRCKARNGALPEDSWPHILLGPQRLDMTKAREAFEPMLLAPFIAYAFAKQVYSYEATLCVLKISDHLRSFSPRERLYAVELMEKFYGYRISTRNVVEADDQHHFW
jgi:hypothetical protein